MHKLYSLHKVCAAPVWLVYCILRSCTPQGIHRPKFAQSVLHHVLFSSCKHLVWSSLHEISTHLPVLEMVLDMWCHLKKIGTYTRRNIDLRVGKKVNVKVVSTRFPSEKNQVHRKRKTTSKLLKKSRRSHENKVTKKSFFNIRSNENFINRLFIQTHRLAQRSMIPLVTPCIFISGRQFVIAFSTIT